MLKSLIPAIAATLVCGGSLFIATRKSFVEKPKSVWLRRSACLIFALFAFAMFQHMIPGFHNVLVFDKIQFSPDAIPFTMYLNFDKLLVGVIIYASLPIRKPERSRCPYSRTSF